MSTEEALQTLLMPLFERYSMPYETIESFTDLFLSSGGRIQIEIPPEIQERMSDEQNISTGDTLPPTLKY